MYNSLKGIKDSSEFIGLLIDRIHDSNGITIKIQSFFLSKKKLINS